MTGMRELDGWWAVAAIGVVLGGAFLWWALADLFLASVELPFVAVLERWRTRRARGDEGNGDADAAASA